MSKTIKGLIIGISVIFSYRFNNRINIDVSFERKNIRLRLLVQRQTL
mgnify:CR=1 FL=1